MRDDDKLNEVHERTRRIETRLTRFMESMGVDAGGKRPVWGDGVVFLPSLSCSVHQIMAVIPEEWDKTQPIRVAISGTVVYRMHLL
jgi:hypothetical protein